MPNANTKQQAARYIKQQTQTAASSCYCLLAGFVASAEVLIAIGILFHFSVASFSVARGLSGMPVQQ
jgi:hypothetical protein